MWNIVLLLPSLLAVLQTTTAEKNGIDIYSLTVESRVSSRFAHTIVTSRVVNRADAAREATFQVELPRKAFITNFSISFSVVIDGVTYPGVVKGKAEAQKQYSAAVGRGESAGLVKTTGRQTEQFEVSVNVAPGSKITFELIYQELLQRRLGMYELLLKVRPQQLVKHLQMDIYIFEPQGISILETESTFMTQELANALTTSQNKTKAHIRFKPTLSQQQKSQNEQDTVLDGDFIVRYDVNRSVSGGSIQIEQGYFVHHFAPEDLPTMSKNVLFVIDKSGSMSGRKIQQTREALVKILKDLSPHDQFNLIVFSGEASQWEQSLVQATEENLNRAVKYASKIHAQGGTNINNAVLLAVEMLDRSNQAELLPSKSVSLIILLTDGEPTADLGETNPTIIQNNVQEAINGRYSLFCLGFGFDVNYLFLEKLALDNGGLARRIYEDSDSELQLQDFYHEVANPLLLSVAFEYPSNAVEDVTQYKFQHHFKGSEMVVAGKLRDQGPDVLVAKVSGQMHMQNVTFQTEASVAQQEKEFQSPKYIFHNFMERLWALLTIQQQLEQRISASGAKLEALEAQVLNLSLKYNFVTPLTHMVVTKPEGQEQSQVAEKPVEVDDGVRRLLLAGSRLQPSLARMLDLPSLESTTPEESPSPGHPQVPTIILPLPGPSVDQLCVDILHSEKPMKLFVDPSQGLEVTGKYENTGFSWIEVTIQKPHLQVHATPERLVVTRGRKTLNTGGRRHCSPCCLALKMTMDQMGLLQLSGPDKVTIGLLSLDDPQRGLMLLLNDTQHFSNNVKGELGRFYRDITWDPPIEPDNTKRTVRVQGVDYPATRAQVELRERVPRNRDFLLDGEDIEL
ncbi:Inter alpha-trypsin inhibitor, heavy chain 4 [Apodemus speciosus]|uniref:Inter alpha-trypsin inhibitor, heavy chain 4 n=1 Tax=Apodemus speciosus TaxID=105296 RepID=A0ABQ0FHG5_APOSI